MACWYKGNTQYDEEIKRLFFNGFKKKEIASRLGVKQSFVESRIGTMRRNGIVVERWTKAAERNKNAKEERQKELSGA